MKENGTGIYQITGKIKVIDLDQEDLTDTEIAEKFPEFKGWITGYSTRNDAAYVLFDGTAKKLAPCEDVAAMFKGLLKLPNLSGFKLAHTDTVTAVYTKNATTHVVIAYNDD